MDQAPHLHHYRVLVHRGDDSAEWDVTARDVTDAIDLIAGERGWRRFRCERLAPATFRVRPATQRGAQTSLGLAYTFSFLAGPV